MNLKRTRFTIILAAIILFSTQFVGAYEPPWVSTYGFETPYPRDSFLTGFAMVSKSESESHIQARDLALADLSGKIRTRVQSELVQISSETRGNHSSSVSLVTKNSVNTTVAGADYLYYENPRNSYALAHIPLESLITEYTNEAERYWEEIRGARDGAEALYQSGAVDRALETLYETSTSFANLYDRWTLVRTLDQQNGERTFFYQLDGVENLDDLRGAEFEVESLIDELASRDARNVGEAVSKIAFILKGQLVGGGRIQVPPVLYESTTFSSEFGRYFAERLGSEIVRTLESGGEQMVFSSQYWEEEDKIRIIVIVSTTSGEKKGRAEVRIPVSAVGNRSLHPQGFDEAMLALREFSDGAISEGGLNIDVWTNKGRDEDALVFTDGEFIQLYYRVNQPAHLQITYRLATGELVMLEESFYIGSDRVNRTVPHPYEFVVQAPYGVENLIVTGFSIEPPETNSTPKYIDGELYQVFGSVKDVVANTRGLGRASATVSKDIRVGEAMLTMTMLEN